MQVEWQPIGTAPDGTGNIMTWDGRHHDVCCVGWHDNDGKPVWYNGDVSVEATHWMPLPTPPADDA